MWRRFCWGLIIIYNLLRMPFISIMNNRRIRYHLIEIISPKSRIRVGSGGSIKLGRKCSFEEGTLLRATGGLISVGNSVYINRNCNLIARDSIVVGNGVTIGPNVCVYDHDHTIGINKSSDYKTAPVVIGNNVWIGANVIILKGVTIGDGSVIGAGAIITKDIPTNTIATVQSGMLLREIK